MSNIDSEWFFENEGGNSWSVYQVVGHIIEGEKTDWITKIKIILSEHSTKKFEPFDRFAMMNRDQTIPLKDLLQEFKLLRTENLIQLKAFNLRNSDLEKTGTHPAFGEVSLSSLLAAWVVHDLSHLSQINRVLAYQYKVAVGPFKEYMSIL